MQFDQFPLVARRLHALARPHRHDFLGCHRHPSDPGDRHAHPGMGQSGSPYREAQPRQTRQAVPERDAEQPDALHDLRCRTEHDPHGPGERQRRQDFGSAIRTPTARPARPRSPPTKVCRIAGQSCARFHAIAGAIVMTTKIGIASGNTVALKNGAPTEILWSKMKSAINGYSVPVMTTAAMLHSMMLLNTSAPSREIGANRPPGANAGARNANSKRLPPMTIASRPRMKTPRAGSLAKAWTELRMPERTRNVPGQRQRKGRDGEQHCPNLQRLPLLDNDRRVQQRRAGQPRQQACILDRIPEPEAAPA